MADPSPPTLLQKYKDRAIAAKSQVAFVSRRDLQDKGSDHTVQTLDELVQRVDTKKSETPTAPDPEKYKMFLKSLTDNPEAQIKDGEELDLPKNLPGGNQKGQFFVLEIQNPKKTTARCELYRDDPAIGVKSRPYFHPDTEIPLTPEQLLVRKDSSEVYAWVTNDKGEPWLAKITPENFDKFLLN